MTPVSALRTSVLGFSLVFALHARAFTDNTQTQGSFYTIEETTPSSASSNLSLTTTSSLATSTASP
jgi:hypothetical protein